MAANFCIFRVQTEKKIGQQRETTIKNLVKMSKNVFIGTVNAIFSEMRLFKAKAAHGF